MIHKNLHNFPAHNNAQIHWISNPNGHECQAVSFFNKVLFSLGRKSEKWTLQGVKMMCRCVDRWPAGPGGGRGHLASTAGATDSPWWSMGHPCHLKLLKHSRPPLWATACHFNSHFRTVEDPTDPCHTVSASQASRIDGS